MKRISIIGCILFLGVILQGCGGGNGIPDTTKNGISEGIATAKEALYSLEEVRSEKMPEQGWRLGKITASSVNEQGQSKKWMYKYYRENENDPNRTTIQTLVWNEGKIEDYTEDLFSNGLNTADYDYVWNDIGDNFKDSSQIAENAYEIYGKESGVTSISIELFWQTEYTNDSPVWFVEPNRGRLESIYFNGITGEQISLK